MKKDDLITITIEDLTAEGLGIGHAQGMAVFVKDTVIGDTVQAKILKMKKTYCYARLEQIIEEGAHRIKPACPAARACGGCQLQMMDYVAQLAFKENRVRSALIRIGSFTEDELEIMPVMGMSEDRESAGPWRYRNKTQFPIGEDKNGQPAAGFYAGRTHHIVPQTDCRIGISENEQILKIVLDHMKKYRIPAYDERTCSGLVRHLMTRKGFATGQLMVCLVINGRKLPFSDQLVKRFCEIPGMTGILINVNPENTNVILGKETICLWGSEYIEDRIGPVRYRISVKSFYQVNPVQTARLYQKVMDLAALTGKETVFDLYCGIGTISLFLAQKAERVYGVEIVPEAVRDARENAALNHAENVQFFEGKAEEIIPEKYASENIRADVVVVDPPRKGCGQALLNTLLSMAPDRIVYVSCDPATLARDLKILCSGGYKLQEVHPCDMFPQTVHVETVVKLTRAISFEYGKDQIGAVIVNGTELAANNASDRVDAGALITEGQNEISLQCGH